MVAQARSISIWPSKGQAVANDQTTALTNLALPFEAARSIFQSINEPETRWHDHVAHAAFGV